MSELWYIESGSLTHSDLPTPIANVMTEPFPPGWWYIENGRLTHSALPEPLSTGAFSGCTNLRQVSIPRSVKFIGAYAFADTALASVRIASDCTYSATSFPEGCTISFYDSEDSGNE